MTQQKNQYQTPPQQQDAVNTKRGADQVDVKRAENEGMTVKPERDTTRREDIQLSKDHPQDPPADSIEGEGSYTAARRYREGVEQSVQRGNSEKLANHAADALDGPEGADLRHAEQRGMMPPPGVQGQQRGQEQPVQPQVPWQGQDPQQGQQYGQQQQGKPNGQPREPQQGQQYDQQQIQQQAQQGQPREPQNGQPREPQQGQSREPQQGQQKQQQGKQQRSGDNRQSAPHR